MEVLAPSPGCLCGRREPVSSTLPSSAWSVSSSLIPSGISRLALMHVCPHLLCLAHGSWSFWKFSGLFWSIFPPAFCLSSFWTYCWLSDLLSERCLNFPARRLFSGYPSWRPVVLLALRGLCYRALSFQAPLLPSPSLFLLLFRSLSFTSQVFLTSPSEALGGCSVPGGSWPPLLPSVPGAERRGARTAPLLLGSLAWASRLQWLAPLPAPPPPAWPSGPGLGRPSSPHSSFQLSFQLFAVL